MFYNIFKHEAYTLDQPGYDSGARTELHGTFSDWHRMATTAVSTVTGSFIFLPSFLLIGYVAFAVNKWLSYQTINYTLDGRVKDIAMLIGGAFTAPHDPVTQQMAFRFYRYINLMHLFAYTCNGKGGQLCEMTLENLWWR